MPLFLNTRGNPTLAVGLCSRCSRKFPLHRLQPDPNFSGLMVCDKDLDAYDPYRLPARLPDNLAMPFARPDVPLPTNPNGVVSQDGDLFLITEDGNDFLVFFGDDDL